MHVVTDNEIDEDEMVSDTDESLVDDGERNSAGIVLSLLLLLHVCY